MTPTRAKDIVVNHHGRGIEIVILEDSFPIDLGHDAKITADWAAPSRPAPLENAVLPLEARVRASDRFNARSFFDPSRHGRRSGPTYPNLSARWYSLD